MFRFPIYSWNAIIPNSHTFPMPMVYIKMEPNFVDFAKKNNLRLYAKFSGTKLYDSIETEAVVSSTAYFPEYRPNFYNSNNYLGLVLQTGWGGYPAFNGEIILQSLEEAPQPQFKMPIPIVNW